MARIAVFSSERSAIKVEENLLSLFASEAMRDEFSISYVLYNGEGNHVADVFLTKIYTEHVPLNTLCFPTPQDVQDASSLLRSKT